MNLRDQLAGLFWLGLSVLVGVESLKNDIGTFKSPGPGFVAFWAALILGTFSIVIVLKGILGKGVRVHLTDLWRGKEWPKVIFVLTSLFLYVLLLNILGYLITTFLLMTFLLGVVGKRRFWMDGVGALAIALAAYIIFYVWLKIQLPKGVFGF